MKPLKAQEAAYAYWLSDKLTITVQRQCHLLKRKIIEIYPPSTIGLVYLRIYLKTDASCLTKNSSL